MVTKIQGKIDLLEIWVLLKTQYDEHLYNGQRLAQIQRQFPHVAYDANEVNIVTGVQSAYSGRKVTKNQAEALSIEYCTNLVYSLQRVSQRIRIHAYT